MKKFICGLCVVFVLSFGGCSRNNESNNETSATETAHTTAKATTTDSETSVVTTTAETAVDVKATLTDSEKAYFDLHNQNNTVVTSNDLYNDDGELELKQVSFRAIVMDFTVNENKIIYDVAVCENGIPDMGNTVLAGLGGSKDIIEYDFGDSVWVIGAFLGNFNYVDFWGEEISKPLVSAQFILKGVDDITAIKSSISAAKADSEPITYEQMLESTGATSAKFSTFYAVFNKQVSEQTDTSPLYSVVCFDKDKLELKDAVLVVDGFSVYENSFSKGDIIKIYGYPTKPQTYTDNDGNELTVPWFGAMFMEKAE